MTIPGSRPVITIDPAIKAGQPTINGTRVPPGVVAGSVFAGDSVEAVADDYGLTADEVLLACWWYVGDCEGSRNKHDRAVVKAWGEWEEQAFRHLGGHVEGPCPHPPKVAKA